MARAQARSVNTVTIALVLFVALWLTSTVLLVILYTEQEKIVSENSRLQEDVQRLVTSQQRQAVAMFDQARPGGPTVVGLLEEARARLAELATGDVAANVETAETKLTEFLRTIRSEAIVPQPERFQGMSYHKALASLYEAYRAQAAVRVDLEGRLAKLESEVATLAQARNDQETSFEKQASELGDQLTSVEQSRAKARQEWQQELDALQADFERARRLAENDLTEERRQNAELLDRVAKLQQRILTFQDRFAELMVGPQELSTARKPDGMILTAVPGDDIVYINRGKNDRLVLGLRFAVYSPANGIPTDGRSKAQIEVVSIGDSTAECEIIRQGGPQPIMQGDLIANPVYDPNRPIRFVVAGEFDIDDDGIPDPDGTEVIEAMIVDWGGTILEDITALTDFVVLGRAPRRPRTQRDASAEEQAAMQRMQERYDRYVAIVDEAQTLAVPTLIQPVFLNFLGYASR